MALTLKPGRSKLGRESVTREGQNHAKSEREEIVHGVTNIPKKKAGARYFLGSDKKGKVYG